MARSGPMISAEARQDLRDIWDRIADDSPDLADRIIAEFHDLFSTLAKMPNAGHPRRDLTARSVLFFPLYSFLVIYRADVRPIRILAVVRGKRDIKRLLRGRTE